MTNYLFFLSVVVAALSIGEAAAQETSLQLVEEGRTWDCVSIHPSSDEGTKRYQNRSGGWGEGIRHYFVLQGDTLMGGKEYKKLCQAGTGFIMGLRQEGDRVYARSPECEEELLYDFGLTPGDTVTNETFESAMKVEAADTITVAGISRRRLTMVLCGPDDIPGTVADYWVEGIGCSAGPAFPFWWLLIGAEPEMLECRQNRQTLFTFADFGYHTETVSSVRNTEVTHSSKDFFDLQGRHLTTPSSRGLYIRDGRKVVVR